MILGIQVTQTTGIFIRLGRDETVQSEDFILDRMGGSQKLGYNASCFIHAQVSNYIQEKLNIVFCLVIIIIILQSTRPSGEDKSLLEGSQRAKELVVMIFSGGNLQVDRGVLKVTLGPQFPGVLVLLAQRSGVLGSVVLGTLLERLDGGGEDNTGVVEVVPQGGVVPVESSLVLTSRANKNGRDDHIDILRVPVRDELLAVDITGNTVLEHLGDGELFLAHGILQDPLRQMEHWLARGSKVSSDGVATVGPISLADVDHGLGRLVRDEGLDLELARELGL